MPLRLTWWRRQSPAPTPNRARPPGASDPVPETDVEADQVDAAAGDEVEEDRNAGEVNDPNGDDALDAEQDFQDIAGVVGPDGAVCSDADPGL